MGNSEVIIAKCWRSEYRLIIGFLASCVFSVIICRYFPKLVVTGSLFTLFGVTVELSIPLPWLVACLCLFLATYRIYNVRYVLDGRGIDAYEWVLGPQRVTSIRYEDIRSIEVDQSVMGRILDVGNLQIGTAAQSSIEVTFYGVAAPHEVLHLIQRERDKRHELDASNFLAQNRSSSDL